MWWDIIQHDNIIIMSEIVVSLRGNQNAAHTGISADGQNPQLLNIQGTGFHDPFFSCLEDPCVWVWSTHIWTRPASVCMGPHWQFHEYSCAFLLAAAVTHSTLICCCKQRGWHEGNFLDHTLLSIQDTDRCSEVIVLFPCGYLTNQNCILYIYRACQLNISYPTVHTAFN